MKKVYKILIIDDEESILAMGEEVLAREGYKVTTINDSEKAINLFSSNKYDLVITDFNMPKFNGLEVIDKLKEHSPETPCILWSGTLEEDIPVLSEFLKKPFDVNALISIVKNILSK